ncbi:MAG: DUF2079 domain-containing protein [Bacillota bacterium]|nr:DUF2079 domain-containing protein [Bacillota bacterium]
MTAAGRRRALWLLAALLGALFTWLKVEQYRNWLLTAWDTGIYLHTMARIAAGDWTGWNGLNGRSILGDAAQWIVYPLAPLLRLGGPVAVFALQGFALAFGAVPLVLLAWRHWGGSGWSLALLPAVLLFPGVIAGAVVEWHPDSLGFFFLAWLIWALESGRDRLFGPLVLLTLAVKNQAAVPVTGLGLTLLLAGLRRGRLDRRGLVALVLPGLLLVLEQHFILPRLEPGLQDRTIAGNYGYLGGSVPEMVLTLLRHPGYLVGAVAGHAGYWVTLLGFFAGLPLLGPVEALPALLVLLVNSLGKAPILGLPYMQYTIWAAPFLAWAAIRATGRWIRRRPEQRRLRAGAAALLLLASATVVTVREGVPALSWRIRPLPPPLVAGLDRAAAQVPRQAIVFGQTGTVVPLYDRAAVGAEPYDRFDTFLARACAKGLGGLRVWVLWAPGRSFAPIVPLDEQQRDLRRILASGPFRLRYAGDGVVLYQSAVAARELAPSACTGR